MKQRAPEPVLIPITTTVLDRLLTYAAETNALIDRAHAVVDAGFEHPTVPVWRLALREFEDDYHWAELEDVGADPGLRRRLVTASYDVLHAHGEDPEPIARPY